MSKLLDKLEQITKGYAKPLGFTSAASKSKAANMVIVAAIDDKDTAAANASAECADAVLVNSLAGKSTATKTKLPWGTYIDKASEEQLASIKDSGCDFILLNTQNSPISLLQEEKLCRMIEIDPAMPDGLLRAVSQLPVDIVLIAGDASVSIQRLLVCQHIANLVGKYLLLRITSETSGEDLRELWETGITGVVIPVADDAKKELAALRQSVDSLPASRRKRISKTSATIPHISSSDTPEEEEPDENE